MVNYNSSNVMECKPVGASCQSALDCCTDKCVDNKCVMQKKCLHCKKKGEKPEEGESCCPGYYKNLKGFCVQDLPKFYIPETSSFDWKKTFKKALHNIIDLVLPTAHAVQTDCSAEDTKAGECKFQQGHQDLTAEQEKEIDEEVKRCFEKGTKEEQDKCYKDVNELKKTYIEGNKKIGKMDGYDGFTQQDYVDEYNIAAFSSKEQSDVKNCQFNSWGDNWMDSTSVERNAEVILRGFEVMMSGVGTQDRIYFKDAKGKTSNIYKRALKVADRIKEYRKQQAFALAQIDRKMACGCMKVFGPTKFSDEQQSAFKKYCDTSDVKSYAENSVEAKEGQIGEDDMGATAISHEKILVEWLRIRAEHQLDRFNSNAMVGGELTELVEELEKLNWDSHKMKEEYIGMYTTHRTAGWIKIAFFFNPFLIFAAMIIEDGFDFKEILTFNSFGSKKSMGAWVADWFNNENVNVSWVDRKSGSEWGCGFLNTKRCQKWKRYLKWPHYKNGPFNSAKANLDKGYCDIRSTQKHCISNIYAPALDSALADTEYATDQWPFINKNPLVDVWVPKFYPHKDPKYFVQDMKIIQEFNQSYRDGVKALKEGLPSGRVSQSYVDRSPFQEEIIEKFAPDMTKMAAPDGTYLSKYTWGQDKINTLKCAVIRYSSCGWLDKCGDQVTMGSDPNPSFDKCFAPANSYEDMWLECNTGDIHTNDANTPTSANDPETIVSTNGVKSANGKCDDPAQHIGFKRFFQSKQDNIMFANYVYQMHFSWPHLSSDESKSYPLLGFEAYLEYINYNMHLLSSLSAKRATEYHDVHLAYKEDLEKKIEAYKSSLNETKMGDPEEEYRFSDELFAVFKKINFSTGQGAGEIMSFASSSTDNDGITGADLNVASTASSAAMRAATRKKAFAHFMREVGQTLRGKKKIEAAKKHMKRFQGEGTFFDREFAKRAKRIEKGKAVIADEAKSSSRAQKEKVEQKTKKLSSAKKFSYGNKKKLSSTHSTQGYQHRNGNSLNHDISNEEVMQVLDSAKKDKTLWENKPGETIFTQVSKAYHRNLKKVLLIEGDVRRKADNSKVQVEIEDKHKIDESAKDELRDLMSQ
jgi:hypothetical protein